MIVTFSAAYTSKAIQDLVVGDWIRITQQEYHAFVKLSAHTAGGYMILLDNGQTLQYFANLTDTVNVLTF